MTDHAFPGASPGLLAAAMGALLLAAACANNDSAERRDSIVAAAEEDYAASHRASAPPDTAGAARSAAPVVLTDENILARLGESDYRQVQLARLGRDKATSAEVKAYARNLLDSHSGSDHDTRALAQQIKIKPKLPAADSSKQELKRLTTRFAALPKGAAFDTAFVRFEVDDHEADLEDAKLMQSKATNAEIKRLLANSVIPELQRHLDKARALTKSLTARKS
jgi:putative membrane protein